jgi:cbb3-type cytochrome oxidase subunit 3
MSNINSIKKNILQPEEISVMPRIIDPNMKFTIESIKNIPNKEQLQKIKQESQPQVSTETKDDSYIFTFFNKYKYIILLIVVIIFLTVLIYIIYKHYNKKEVLENKKEEPDKIEKDNSKPEPLNKEIKEKINNYVSNFIMDDDEEENETELEVKKEDYETNEEQFRENNNYIIHEIIDNTEVESDNDNSSKFEILEDDEEEQNLDILNDNELEDIIESVSNQKEIKKEKVKKTDSKEKDNLEYFKNYAKIQQTE